jgi:hypothetical protein
MKIKSLEKIKGFLRRSAGSNPLWEKSKIDGNNLIQKSLFVGLFSSIKNNPIQLK